MGEETGGTGAQALAQSGFKADFAIALEPTDLKVVYANKGVLRRWLESRWRAAHSANPALGRNTIYPLLPLLKKNRDHPRPTACATDSSPARSRNRQPRHRFRRAGVQHRTRLLPRGSRFPDASRLRQCRRARHDRIAPPAHCIAGSHDRRPRRSALHHVPHSSLGRNPAAECTEVGGGTVVPRRKSSGCSGDSFSRIWTGFHCPGPHPR